MDPDTASVLTVGARSMMSERQQDVQKRWVIVSHVALAVRVSFLSSLNVLEPRPRFGHNILRISVCDNFSVANRSMLALAATVYVQEGAPGVEFFLCGVFVRSTRPPSIVSLISPLDPGTCLRYLRDKPYKVIIISTPSVRPAVVHSEDSNYMVL